MKIKNESNKTKLYLVRREDFFEARSLDLLPKNCCINTGSIWIEISLTEEQKNLYNKKFSICEA